MKMTELLLEIKNEIALNFAIAKFQTFYYIAQQRVSGYGKLALIKSLRSANFPPPKFSSLSEMRIWVEFKNQVFSDNQILFHLIGMKTSDTRKR